MRIIARRALTFITWIAAWLFSYWMVFGQFLPGGIDTLAAFLFAAFVASYVWRKSERISHDGLISHIFLGAAVVGAVGFSVGFFGPLIFAPQANQGPLLGLFITGPLGFIGGGVAGAVWWHVRRRGAR